MYRGIEGVCVCREDLNLSNHYIINKNAKQLLCMCVRVHMRVTFQQAKIRQKNSRFMGI